MYGAQPFLSTPPTPMGDSNKEVICWLVSWGNERCLGVGEVCSLSLMAVGHWALGTGRGVSHRTAQSRLHIELASRAGELSTPPLPAVLDPKRASVLACNPRDLRPPVPVTFPPPRGHPQEPGGGASPGPLWDTLNQEANHSCLSQVGQSRT